mmetsp:Transcript_33137/g.51800  ORF Transcript_33137/g.51800 Transcript_33137/m.51800 type:complete len:98 (+) Transcript_33137:35-328(+)
MCDLDRCDRIRESIDIEIAEIFFIKVDSFDDCAFAMNSTAAVTEVILVHAMSYSSHSFLRYFFKENSQQCVSPFYRDRGFGNRIGCKRVNIRIECEE